MVEQITPQQALERQQAGAVILDVRETDEFAAGHATGAVNIPLSELQSRLGDVPDADDLLVICQAGGRSQQAALWLDQQGVAAANVSGGTFAWASEGLPVD
ncbi:rhodanese-like domain-containing protein [Pseudoclavibacter sp. CFCC 13611]|uniref:rhodanese-like domain-containing protein n=1 Tax=Pseudoclavibacter sp. CFCC 13611 TaxID=2615178 RepID=UPI0013014A82|nr:rhodanese-like domain-containing protein [Pseudoclavibacter sp. CFCC 13611]KAB1663214.1 rhodanese-like domain-containing protein [Pseudoclavibacter sp. CFCC 13611]